MVRAAAALMSLVSLAIGCPVKALRSSSSGDGFDRGDRPAIGKGLPQGVAVVGGVGEQGLAFAEGGEHVRGGAPVMRLTR